MKCSRSEVISRLIKKAAKSPCRFRIAAIGMDMRGVVIGSATNLPYLPKAKGGVHAEELLISRSPRSLKTIIIARVGVSGILRPISPCSKCSDMAQKYGIKIVSILE